MTTDQNGNMIMPVSPMYGGGNGSGGFGDGSGWWILLLFVLLGGFGNGWGNRSGGFGGGGTVGDIYPWMNQSNQINGGFRDQMLNSNIAGIQNSITSGFGDVQNSLCAGFAGVNASIANAQANNMQNLFGVQSALQNCCCENRAGLADLKYTVATEACADRATVTEGIRDVIENCNRNNQSVLDKLCQLELDGKNDRINDLERQLTMANLAASQTAQTAAIRAGQVAEIDAMYQRLRDCPVPTMPVYGSQPIFTCPTNYNNGCGCGCNGGGF